ncbi:helix-turn-helix domain-containing protein [Clostridium sp. PL3]|uniref:Helix-turn-helix domain-containing protein n=1 Tax=Clostridium thailandense TaxID=2794346 RepID=A0A949TY17_9CLOT|nr:helix-turn-helix domain-containing protein [Clostridium thailandense]MBV7272594.1 helix-turn-helix domain-containing protein [Clostridium thailandense]
MSVLMSEIVDNLLKYNPDFRIKHDSYVKCCRFLDSDTFKLNSDDIYLGNISDLLPNVSLNKPVNLLLFTDTDLPEYLNNNFMINYILIKQNTSSTKIFNELQDLFSFHETERICTQKLFSALCKGTNIKQLLDTCMEMLGNPLLLIDSFLYLIDYSGFSNGIDEPIWKECIATGHIPSKYINQRNFSLTIRNTIDSDIMWEVGSLNHKQLLVRIRSNNTVIAYLKVLEYNKKITKGDVTLIHSICNILALAIEKSRYSFFIPKSPVETLIINLLKGNLIAETSVEEIENQFKRNLYNNYYILSFYIKGQVPDLTTKLYHMKGLITSFFYCYYTVIYNDHVVTLIDKKKKDEPVIDTTLSDSFIQLLSDNQLTVGISRRFHNIMDISKFHIQSVKAAELGFKLNKENSPYFYNDYAVYHLFDTYSFKENLEEFCDPLILELINRDKEKGTSYALTLYNYIQNNFDVQKTSNLMNVHYNTMKYRLQKIQDILKIDLNNSNTVFHINISFRILELLGYVKLKLH